MKREERRVRLARRQALLAEVSQRAAMRSMADALAQEHRSAALAEHTKTLITAYGGRSNATDGASLAHNARFAASLASLAQNAEAARNDAAQQAVWQARALEQAQTRARRQSERLESAVTAFRAAQERRAHDPSIGAAANSLARLMQSSGETRSQTPSDLSSGPAHEDPRTGDNHKSRTAP